jgi:hypothetical protein
MLRRLLEEILGARVRGGTAAAGGKEPAARPIEPAATLFNKMYEQPPFDDPARRKALLDGLATAARVLDANRAGGHAYLADDMLVWFRNLGFLTDPEFARACGPEADNPLIRARIWRVHTLCWAARSCLGLRGDFVDLGCYDARTVAVMARYAGFGEQSRTWWLYDLFEDPPAESRKAGHGPELKAQVEERLRGLGSFRVIAGRLPDSLAQGAPRRVAFGQIDLNDAAAELTCLDALYERVVPGGMLVLDDFGFARYRESHRRETAFFARRGVPVLELPTGQGLVVKR